MRSPIVYRGPFLITYIQERRWLTYSFQTKAAIMNQISQHISLHVQSGNIESRKQCYLSHFQVKDQSAGLRS